jgi:hypothetical protein
MGVYPNFILLPHGVRPPLGDVNDIDGDVLDLWELGMGQLPNDILAAIISAMTHQ